MARRTSSWMMLGALAGLVALLPAVEAAAHGELRSQRPDRGATRNDPPGHVRLTFTEAPTEDSVVRVLDGCGRDVVREQYVAGRTKHVFLRKGRAQPGEWEVSYRVISAEDGHQTRESYNFSVRGQPECSEPEPDPDPDDDAGAEGGDRAAPAPPPGDEDSSFPVVPVALGAGGIIGLAALVRIFSARGG